MISLVLDRNLIIKRTESKAREELISSGFQGRPCCARAARTRLTALGPSKTLISSVRARFKTVLPLNEILDIFKGEE